MVKVFEIVRDKGFINDKIIIVEFGLKLLFSGMVKMIFGNNMIMLFILYQNIDVWFNFIIILLIIYIVGFDVNWVVYYVFFDLVKKVIFLFDYGWDLKEYYIFYEGDWCLYCYEIKCDCVDVGKEVYIFVYQVFIELFFCKLLKLDVMKEVYFEIKIIIIVYCVVEEKIELLGVIFIVEIDMFCVDVNFIV